MTMKIKQLKTIPAHKASGKLEYADMMALSEVIRGISAICCLGLNESFDGWSGYYKSMIRAACGKPKGDDYRKIFYNQLEKVIEWLAEVETSLTREIGPNIIKRLYKNLDKEG